MHVDDIAIESDPNSDDVGSKYINALKSLCKSTDLLVRIESLGTGNPLSSSVSLLLFVAESTFRYLLRKCSTRE